MTTSYFLLPSLWDKFCLNFLRNIEKGFNTFCLQAQLMAKKILRKCEILRPFVCYVSLLLLFCCMVSISQTGISLRVSLFENFLYVRVLRGSPFLMTPCKVVSSF